MDPVQSFAADPLAVGNAVRLGFVPPADPTWKGVLILRKIGAITGPTDATATVAFDGSGRAADRDREETRWLLDYQGLVNGSAYTYAIYAYDAVRTYSTPRTATATPAISYTYRTFDLKTFLVERLKVFLREALVRDALRLKTGVQDIDVFSGTPAPGIKFKMPAVTVHRDEDRQDQESIGHDIGPDEWEESSALWVTREGVYFAQQVTVLGWTLNPEERDALYGSLKECLVVHAHELLETGEAAQFSVGGRDAEELAAYDAPVYFAVFNVSCLALVQWFGSAPPLRDVTAEPVLTPTWIREVAHG